MEQGGPLDGSLASRYADANAFIEKLRRANDDELDDLLADPVLAPMLRYCVSRGAPFGLGEEWSNDFRERVWLMGRMESPGGPDGVRSGYAYLMKIAMNIVAKGITTQVKLRQRLPTLSLDERGEALDHARLRERVEDMVEQIAMGHLEAGERTALLLRCLDEFDHDGRKRMREVLVGMAAGKSLAEVAQELDMPVNTVKSNWRRFCLYARSTTEGERSAGRRAP